MVTQEGDSRGGTPDDGATFNHWRRTVDRTNAVLDSSSAWRELERELDRSRRGETAFTLLQATLLPAPDGLHARYPTLPHRRRWWRAYPKAAESDASRLVLSAAVALRHALRTVDLVWTDDVKVFALLWQADELGKKGCVERILTEGPAVLRGAVVRAATFPIDALTLRALIDCLEDGEPILGTPRPA